MRKSKNPEKNGNCQTVLEARATEGIQMNDPVVKTIKHAKALSLKKWHKARKDLETLLNYTSQPCGFCFHFGNCIDCEVSEKCFETDEQVNTFLNGVLKYIEEDLIPFIENFEPKE